MENLLSIHSKPLSYTDFTHLPFQNGIHFTKHVTTCKSLRFLVNQIFPMIFFFLYDKSLWIVLMTPCNFIKYIEFMNFRPILIRFKANCLKQIDKNDGLCQRNMIWHFVVVFNQLNFVSSFELESGEKKKLSRHFFIGQYTKYTTSTNIQNTNLMKSLGKWKVNFVAIHTDWFPRWNWKSSESSSFFLQCVTRTRAVAHKNVWVWNVPKSLSSKVFYQIKQISHHHYQFCRKY